MTVLDGAVDLELPQDVLEIVGGLLDRVRVHPFVSRHHHPLVSRQPLDLLLHVAPLKSAAVVAPARADHNTDQKGNRTSQISNSNI